MRIAGQVASTLLAGFIFRPFMFFIVPGTLLLLFSAYVNSWMFIHFFTQYLDPALLIAPGNDRTSAALAAAYHLFPYTFVIGLTSLLLALQLLGLGIMALQSKRYFEEMFFLASSMLNENRQRVQNRPVNDTPIDTP
jgi:hypothetical protein